MEPLDRESLVDLENLALAVAIETERQQLVPDLRTMDPNAQKRWQELQELKSPREYLHRDVLHQLETQGYLVGADDIGNVQFMTHPFWLYVQEFFRTRQAYRLINQPKDLVISLLNLHRGPSEETDPEIALGLGL